MKRNTENTLVENMQILLEGQNTLFENELGEIKKLILQTSVYAQGTQALYIMQYLRGRNLTPQEIYEYRKLSNSYLISCCSYQKYLNGLTIANLKGDFLTYGITLPYGEIMDRGFYASEEGFSFVEPYYQDGQEHKTSHVFALIHSKQKTKEQDREIRVAELKYSMLNDIYQVSDAGMTAIIDTTSRQVIYATQQDWYLKGQSLDACMEGILNAKRNDIDAGFFKIYDKHAECIIVYDLIDHSDWYTVKVIPEKEIIAKLFHASIMVLLLMLFCFIVLLALVVYMISYYTKNIRILKNEVRNISDDNLELSVEIHSNDEVEALFLDFKQMLERIRHLIEKVKFTEKEKHQSELRALQYQINPHFMYNTLNTIKYLAQLGGNRNITEVTDNFMELMYINMHEKSMITVLGQFTRNYTQTVKRAADNKRRYAPGKGHSACLLWGYPKGAAPHLAHDFAKQSVVCYTLCRRCRENAVAAGEGKGI